MRRLQILGAAAAYIAVLLWAYAAIISPTFAYYGYNLNWPDPYEMIWLITLSLLPIAFLPLTLSRPSVLIVWWMYLTVYIPSVLMPALSLTLGPAKLLSLQLALLACMAILTAAGSARVLVIPGLKLSPLAFWPAVVLLWGSCLVFVCVHFRISTLIANLASLFIGGSEYTIRSGFFEQLTQAGRVLGYATGQTGEALDPFLIAYGLVYGRKRLLIAGILGQLLIFAVLGSKSILFSTLFLVVVCGLLRFYKRSFGLALTLVLITVTLLSAFVDRMSDGIFLSSITTRRTLLDPGLLTGFYFEHYSQTAHAGLGYHFGQEGKAVPAPSYEIGLVYFGDEHVDANANLWAQGFADFGIAGIFGFTLLLALIIWLYNSVAARRNPELAIVLLAMQAFSFSNSAPLTTVITHGGLASALLLWCAPSPEEEICTDDVASFRGFATTDAVLVNS